MKTENKMSELKIAARNAHDAKIDAAKSRDDAWEIYIEAVDVFNAAEDFSEKTQKDADDFETGDYETLDYDPVGK